MGNNMLLSLLPQQHCHQNRQQIRYFLQKSCTCSKNDYFILSKIVDKINFVIMLCMHHILNAYDVVNCLLLAMLLVKFLEKMKTCVQLGFAENLYKTRKNKQFRHNFIRKNKSLKSAAEQNVIVSIIIFAISIN